MNPSAYYPYRSEEARARCLAYFDSRATTQWPAEFENRMVETSYGQTFVSVGGPPDAPPLALLHGAATPSLMWSPNVRALCHSYRTFAIDQVGDFGRSTCSRPVSQFSDLLQWMDELFNALASGQPMNLVGISYGGALAAEYTLKFPERVGKTVLLAPAAIVLRVKTEFMARLMWAAWSSKKRLPPLVRWIFADMQRKDPAWVDDTINQLQMNMTSMQRRPVPLPRVWNDAEWGRMKRPLLFLVGEHEVIYSPYKAVQRLRRVAPQVQTEVIPDAGHDLTFAQAELVNERILAFLNAPAG